MPETREHFIAECGTLQKHRDIFNKKTETLMNIRTTDLINLSSKIYTHLVLDYTHPNVPEKFRPNEDKVERFELLTRELIQNLHLSRLRQLNPSM